MWHSEDDIAAWYASPAYHNDQYIANIGQTCQERYDDAFEAAGKRLEWVRNVYPEAVRLLDVGAANMAFVDRCRKRGYLACGIDPHPLRSDCQAGTWADVKECWDVICLHDVIEHLTRPADCLRKLREHLMPGGVLIIETPEYQAPNPRWTHHIKPKEHVVLFSKAAAEELYERNGFMVTAFYRPLRARLGKMVHFLEAA